MDPNPLVVCEPLLVPEDVRRRDPEHEPGWQAHQVAGHIAEVGDARDDAAQHVVGLRGLGAAELDLLRPDCDRYLRVGRRADAMVDVDGAAELRQSMRTWSGASSTSRPSVMLTEPMKSATKREFGNS